MCSKENFEFGVDSGVDSIDSDSGVDSSDSDSDSGVGVQDQYRYLDKRRITMINHCLEGLERGDWIFNADE
uniref:Uncharacterized protein n=1 Tax=Panagrolaimus superbus TaxID=310955 RepID=A0A914YK19_9BILA